MTSRVKTAGGWEKIAAYDYTQCPPPECRFKKKKQGRRFIEISENYIVLDTETSHIGEDMGWIYQWAVYDGENYGYGRTPRELTGMLLEWQEKLGLSEEKRLCVYVHNLAYDLQYLKHYIKEAFPDFDIFATDARHPLIATAGGFRFLCSYRLTALPLKKLAESYAKKYRKAAGEIDYNIVHYQDEELQDDNWEYMFSDVASQHDGIGGFLSVQGYGGAGSSPVTSTGFVRNACRKSASAQGWRKEFLKSALSMKEYNLCHQAFAGGWTGGNYRYEGVTVRGDKLRHKDFTSSYPARQMLDEFPAGKGTYLGAVESAAQFERILKSKVSVFVLKCEEILIKAGITAPYISKSKCIHAEDAITLNGKLAGAKNMAIAITNADYDIIRNQYDMRGVSVSDMLYWKKAPAPQWMKDEVMDYFSAKSRLKGKDDVLYMRGKNRLNSIYGMSVTAIIRNVVEMNADLIMDERKPDMGEEWEQINRYYDSYSNFNAYQIGIFVTAYARKALFEMIESAGYENFIYADTDSIFYLENEENKKRMDAFAKKCRERAMDAGAYSGKNILGFPTDESPIRAFRFLHAKCYAMEELDEKTGDYNLNVVIAGIPKKSTKWKNGLPVTITNAEELGNIDNLQDGFIFRHNGGTRSVFNEMRPARMDINGHLTEFSSSTIILEIEKELSDGLWCLNDDGTVQGFSQELFD